MVGVLEVLFEPNIAVRMALTIAMNSPEAAVPMVNLETTS
jgi:hypothetical protein